MADLLQRLERALADRYVVEGEIGSGGMATVYLARDLKHDRRVAIKVLKPELIATGSERFLREIRVTAGLSHPHILPLLDSGEAGGLPFFVMPYVEGESLRDRLKREKQLPLEEAIRIAREVADALATAHHHGIVHRDIKPANILLEVGHAVVADFGILRATGGAGNDSTTTAGSAIGTPAYMSPEQAAGQSSIDGRSDVYALGCVLYEMLTGAPPFTGDAARVMARHISQPPPPVSLFRAVPAAIDAALLRALAKSPEQRFQTADEFSAALAAAAAAVPGGRGARLAPGVLRTRGRPPTDAASGRRVLAGLTAVALALGGLYVIRQWLDGADVAVSGPRSIAVIAMRTLDSTPTEAGLAADLARVVTVQLNRGESLVALAPQSLSGAMLELGIEGPLVASTDEALRVASASNAELLVTIALDLEADTAQVWAEVCEVAQRCRERTPLNYRDLSMDLQALAAPVTHQVLGLSGSVLHRQTDSPEALRFYLAGQRQLEIGHVDQAVDSLARAVEADSTFAMALHNLAVARYWQAVRAAATPDQFASVGRIAAAAIRHAQRLAPSDRNHVLAFDRFLRGEYAEARVAYREILARDSTDAWAWLMLGTVEWEDTRLVERPDGSLAPVASLNVAMRAFKKAVDRSPGFGLGYGHLFELPRRVRDALDTGEGGRGFYLPGPDRIDPWDEHTPRGMIAFLPVALDSLTWVRQDSMDQVDRARAERGASDLEESLHTILRRWARSARGEAPPLEALTLWALAQRARIREPTSPADLARVAQAALGYATEALALRADTLPSDLQRLATLYLAAGDPARAAQAASRAVETAPSRQNGDAGVLTAGILNVLVARGQPGRALDLAGALPVDRRFHKDRQSGELLDDGGAEREILRLSILAATATGDGVLERELESLAGYWPARTYTPDQIRQLKQSAVARLAPLLVAEPNVIGDWMQDAELAEPLRLALRSAVPGGEDARERILQALRSDSCDVPDAARAYVLAHAAARAGDPALAVRIFSRLDSLAFGIDVLDVGWGLRSLSYLGRAKSYAALDDPANARLWFERFLGVWADADSLAYPLVEEARGGLARVGGMK